MMGKGILTLFILILVIAIILFLSAAYTVDEREQVIITQWGEPIGDPISDPGLRWKRPFIQEVHRFEKRIMEWNGDATQIPTKDKRYIWVDSTARWRIEDPLQFFKRVRTEQQAQSRLDDIVDGATRDVITSLDLIESVRSTSRPFEAVDESFASEQDLDKYKTSVGRHEIGARIKDKCVAQLKDLGIEIVDVRLRRINYVEEVRSKVYARMISERKRMAERFRSEGQGKTSEVEGRKEKDLKTILSKAYRQAEEIRGEADAEAVRIYAEAFGADPEFYAFMKTLESYEKTLDGSVDLILTTNSDFFRYVKTMGEWKE